MFLSWDPSHFGTADSYRLYRFEYTGVFKAPSVLPTAFVTIAPECDGDTCSLPTTYRDVFAPFGKQLAYFIRAHFTDGTLSGISNFATVQTPTPSESPVTVGVASTTEARCFPFMCNTSGTDVDQSIHYQQVYAASAFNDPTQINSLTFFRIAAAAFGLSNTILSGNYQISLSTTTRAVGELSTDLASNIGPDSVVVFSGSLGGSANPSFTVALTTPFGYSPAEGNLLLDVVVTNQDNVPNNGNNGYNDSDETGTSTTRAFVVTGMGPAVETRGLVTQFNRCVECEL